MDVNGSRFHLLLGRDDWLGRDDHHVCVSRSGSPPEEDLSWDEEWTALSLSPMIFRFPYQPGARLYNTEDRRGAGRDRYGNWYWIAESGTEIRVLRACGNTPGHFWSAGDLAVPCKEEAEPGTFRPVPAGLPPENLEFRGLGVTHDHYLVAGTLDPAGLLIFDLHAGGPPAYIFWPLDVPFTPYDIVPAPGGGVWVLDREHACYWGLDRYFRVTGADRQTGPAGEDDFIPVNGLPGKERNPFPAGISLDLLSPLEVVNPVAIEALQDGTVLILDSVQGGCSVIYRYRQGIKLGEGVCINEILDRYVDTGTGLDNTAGSGAHDMAFVPSPGSGPANCSGTLYIVSCEGNQAFAFSLRADNTTGLLLDPLPRYFPMRLFSGKALVAAGDGVFYDLRERWMPLIEMPKPRYRQEGTLETRIFDGREPDCVWHRLFMDALVPPGTGVRIESRSANHPDMCAQMPWHPEPRPYRRHNDTELPYYRAFSGYEAEMDGTGTWELLLQRACGRYLQLRLTLEGTGRCTPRLRALRVYYPRFSYLREYLPAVYQEDKTSSSFLERFLANLEGLYTALEGRIEQAQALFDIRSTAEEYMDWLAEWIGVILDPAWDGERRRLFLSHAVELFKQRGTPAGLLRAILLGTHPCPDEAIFKDGIPDCMSHGGIYCESSSYFLRYPVRVIERFLTRGAPGILYGDPDKAGMPGEFSDFEKQGTDKGAALLDTLNVDACNESDLYTYREFLARRYRHIKHLNNAYQVTGERALGSFEEAGFPAEGEMPSEGGRLYDWVQFVSLVLPIKRNANKFIVLIPADLNTDQETRQKKMALVRHIVELEKPAHTSFEVKFYWALFRVGEVRLGLDTVLDAGSRFVALCLGSEYLAEGYLASSHPWNVSGRIVAGRDQTGSEMVI